MIKLDNHSSPFSDEEYMGGDMRNPVRDYAFVEVLSYLAEQLECSDHYDRKLQKFIEACDFLAANPKRAETPIQAVVAAIPATKETLGAA